MNEDRLFLDTYYVQALLNRRDQHHTHAKAWWPRVRGAAEVWVTEAVLVEIGNAFSRADRGRAGQFIQECYRAENFNVVPVDSFLLNRALHLYLDRPDKSWGLTDCISFVVMADRRLTDALTGDAHFRQAGFRALLET